MPKATVTTKSGATVMIEGTQAELVALLALLEQGNEPAPAAKPAVVAPKPKQEGGRATPTGLVGEMIEGGFFSKPKPISEVKDGLEQIGHFYPVTTLSPVLLRFVKKRELRRIKTDGQWTYVR